MELAMLKDELSEFEALTFEVEDVVAPDSAEMFLLCSTSSNATTSCSSPS